MRYFYLILFLFVWQFTSGQNCIILDKDTEDPIQNVQITNEDKSKMAMSDENGKADLGIFDQLELLTFTHVSYVEFELLKKQIYKNNVIIFLQFNSELLNEVFLSASKAQEKTTRIAEQIAIVSNKDIQNSTSQTTADILAEVPGIKIQKTQFGGGSPVIRGMEANRILLVVDGVRMNNAIYRKGHLQNSITVSPNLLERIEVIFGPSSVVYGSDALGGVIHYYTRTPKTSEKTNINTEFLSRVSSVNEEFTVQVGIEAQMKKAATYTSVSFSRFGDLKMGEFRPHGFQEWGKQYEYSNNTDNFYNPIPVDNSNPDKQRNVGFSQIDFLQKVLIPFDEKNNVIFNLQYSTSSDIGRFDKLTEIKDNELKYANWYYGPQKRFLLSTQLNLDLDKKGMNEGVITMAYQNIQESRIQRKLESLDRTSRFEDVNVFSINGDFTTNFTVLKDKNFGYGFEIAYNDVRSTSKGDVLEVNNNEIVGISDTYRVQTRYPDGGSSYLSSAMYADYRQDIKKRSTLNTGIRLTNTNLRASWIDSSYISLPDDDIYLKNTAVTLTVGYVFKPNKNWQINGVLSSGFRSPNIDDIGKIREKNGQLTVPNINLKPEFAYNFEAGFIKYFKNKNYYLGLTSYYTLLTDYIARVPFSLNERTTMIYDDEEYDLVSNVNNNTAYIFGTTLAFRGKLTNTLNAGASFTYTKGEAYDTGESLSSIPPLFGRVELNYIKNRIETGFYIDFNGRKKLEDYNITEGIDNIEQTPFLVDENEYYGNPSWQTLNFYFRYKATKNIDLLAAFDNVLDQHYKEFASAISAPGRNLSVTIIGSF
jgi:hemoglobin/transferrin/lactoferrin receptor protein